MNGASDGLRPSVVLVDDSPEVRAVVRMVLDSHGFEVVGEGQDGDEAIVLAHRHQPSLLLLDASMPGVDGLEALPAVLAVSPDTAVVVFTGFEDAGLAAYARELGAADLLEKSIDLDELPGRLRAVLHAEDPRTPGPGVPPPAEPRPVDQGLTEHVQEFRELFDRAEIGMATLTSSGGVVRANRALAQLMSSTPQELVGVDYGRLTVGQGHALDRALDDICTLGSDLATFEHELPGTVAGEEARTARVTLAPIRDSRHRVLYVFAQVQDVTSQRAIESDLRRSEENFRRLVTAVSEYAIFMLDVDGRVVSWNAGAQRIKGYRAHEIIGSHFRVFYPEDERAVRPEQNLEAALRDGSFAEEGWRVRQDGSRFWASVVITAVYDERGRHVGFAKVTRDRSEQREREEERRSFIEERIQLLAMTAHELRNPTAVIEGSARLLLQASTALSAEHRSDLLANIRASGARLRRLAADLTRASHAESELLPLSFEEVSLVDTLHAAVARMDVSRPEVAVQVEVSDDATFPADPGRLAQALDNLLENAVRHGATPITLSATVEDDSVRLQVTDAGPGVGPELEPHLFERSVSGTDQGTGLGLNLVREVARRHGGDASYLPPDEDRPTTFELRIPRERADDPA
jgi:PAS domain S-box-containing protein